MGRRFTTASLTLFTCINVRFVLLEYRVTSFRFLRSLSNGLARIHRSKLSLSVSFALCIDVLPNFCLIMFPIRSTTATHRHRTHTRAHRPVSDATVLGGEEKRTRLVRSTFILMQCDEILQTKQCTVLLIVSLK